MSDEMLDETPTGRNALAWFIGIVAVIATLVVVAARITTDLWWFQAVEFQTVFTTRLAAQVTMFLVFGAVMFAVVFASMAIAYRLRPKVRRANLDSEFLVQARDAFDARSKLLMALPAGLFGLMAAMSALAMTDTFLAAWRATEFGQRDAYYGVDASFYVFHLPVLQFVVGFLLLALSIGTVAAAVVHFMTGSLTVKALSGQGNARKSIAAHRQLSIQLGLALLALAASTYLGRFEFLTSANSLFTGVSYTDATARMPIQTILAYIVLVVALVCFFNAYRVRWSVPGVGITLLLVTSLLMSGPYPWLIQEFQVLPNEPDKERQYIGRHLEATRAAFGIDDEHVEITDYEATTEVAAGQLRADAEALPAIRLIDPAVVARTYEQLQQVRGYYRFSDTLDVDRYVIDGKPTDAVVAVRELDFAATNAEVTWNNRRTVYTHGHGIVAAYGNQRHGNGEPVFFSGGIPTVGLLGEHESRIYYGERSGDWVVVGAPEGAEPVELDTPTGGEGRTESKTTFQGDGGVPVGNWLARGLFAVRFGDVNLLLSERVNEASQLLMNRVPLERVHQVAPWLTLDSDPYPSVVDGRIVWIIDGYTTSDGFPNAQRLDYAQAISDSRTSNNPLRQPGQQVNYIRNSVKATVDAYDGTVRLYEWDEEDPILQTWSKVYPGTVQPKEDIPDALLEHLRYPADLFKVQREILGRYHTKSSDTWYQESDVWQVPNDPVKGGDNKLKEPPYYLTIRWPGDAKPHYANTSIFVPKGRENLSVYMSANADATSPDYGRLRVLKLSDEQQIPGPGQTYNAIRTDETVADRLLPFNREGSDTRAIFGNLLTLPLGGGLLYVQPIYTMTSSTSGGYPALRFVVVRFGENVGIGDTLQAALDQVFKGDAGAETGERPTGETPSVPNAPAPGEEDPGSQAPSESTSAGASTPEPTSSPTDAEGRVRASLDEAQRLFEEADAALRSGDLAGYQAKTTQAKAKVEEALAQLDGQ